MLPDPGANDALTAEELPEIERRRPARLRLRAPARRLARRGAGRDRARPRGRHADQRRPRERGAAGQRPGLPGPDQADRPAAPEPGRGGRARAADRRARAGDHAAAPTAPTGRTGSRPSASARSSLDDVIDTTGAGDAFAAGFLSAWPGPPQAALAAGARLAARAVTQTRRAPVTRVLFVCMGNICRSPTAEGVMRSLVREAGLEHEIEIDSAGVGDWHAGDPPDRRATEAARARGITLEGAARKVTRHDFEDFDLLLAADRENLRDLRAVAPAGTRIEDPAAARVRSGIRRRARPRRPRPVLRRPARLRDRARPGRGRVPRPAR